MEQTMVRVRGRMLSWADFGGAGPTVLALHGSFGRGTVFAPVADRLQGAARVVALDQRGHGLADHGGPFTRAEFVADAAAVIDRLGGDPVVVLGHSLGGITAHQMVRRRSSHPASRAPEAGHWIHDDDPAGCAAAILDFLSSTGVRRPQ